MADIRDPLRPDATVQDFEVQLGALSYLVCFLLDTINHNAPQAIEPELRAARLHVQAADASRASSYDLDVHRRVLALLELAMNRASPPIPDA